MGRKIALVLSLAVLLVTGVLGLYNGTTEWDTVKTPLQKSVTGGVILYGVFGLISAYGLFRRRTWSVTTAIAWGVVVTYVAGASVIAYGGEGASVGGAIAGSAVTAAVALGVIWTSRATARHSRPTTELISAD